jgi:hypothetical protein
MNHFHSYEFIPLVNDWFWYCTELTQSTCCCYVCGCVCELDSAFLLLKAVHSKLASRQGCSEIVRVCTCTLTYTDIYNCTWWCRREFVNERGTEWSAPPLYEWRHDSVNTSVHIGSKWPLYTGICAVCTHWRRIGNEIHLQISSAVSAPTFCLEDQSKE